MILRLKIQAQRLKKQWKMTLKRLNLAMKKITKNKRKMRMKNKLKKNPLLKNLPMKIKMSQPSMRLLKR